MKPPHLADTIHCTGCGACVNVCPVQAITMEADSEGFIMPKIESSICIHCGRCESTCPVLVPKYVNNPSPDCYAITAKDEIRAVSSSGGFFTVAAEEILNRGGVVFGAAWTEDWHVEHIFVDSLDQLDKLRSSKYLQSDTRMAYREAKHFLDSGRPVLYSGCPCQIAGLYSFLKKDYSDLYTAEIICHGVPSPKAFHKYLYDNFGNKPINKINFRDKGIFKWSTTSNIYFENGDEYHKNEREDAFYKGFLPCMILRNSCAQCPFSKLPRQADLTMGDFWGSEKHRAGINDQKGLSAVLVNSQKGRIFFEEIRCKFTLCEKTSLDAITHINKTVLHPFHQHPGRKHFFSSMDIKPFNQLVEDSLTHHYDIGIVGLWYGINYGSVLTYYALYSVLKEQGYDPVMLPKPNDMWSDRFNRPDTIAQRFIWKNCNVFNPYNRQEDYIRANDVCKDFILGSDVVWNYEICGREAGHFFFFDWVKYGHRKIGYACSCGDHSRLDGPEEYLNHANYYLRKFDAVSVREDTSVTFLNNFCGREDVQQVLDPVFLCDRTAYDQAADNHSDVHPSKFVFAYLLNYTMYEGKLRLVNHVATQLSCAYHIAGNPNVHSKAMRYYGDSVLPVISVEDWLYYIKNCEFFVGDSYHGLCFALIFHRPFIVVFGKNARIDSLLKLVGLEDRKLDNLDDPAAFNHLLNAPIDWNKVDTVLLNQRQTSLEWLKAALTKPIPPITDMDVIKEGLLTQVAQLSESQNELQHRIQELEHELSELASRGILRKSRKLIAGGIQCCKDHGLIYTLKLLVKKIRNAVM